MKIFLTLFLILLPLKSFCAKGIAFYDLKEFKELNNFIRSNQKSNFNHEIKTLYDSLVYNEDNSQGVSFVKFVNDSFGFIIFEYDLSFKVTPLEVVPLSKTDFKIDVDLKNRQIILTDQSVNKIKLIFPIAHGGLSIDYTKIMTPKFKNAFIDKRTIISKRVKPTYYRGLPFIRVMTNKSIAKGWTGIGFHIKQNSSLLRSPDSHGCMRLRKFDLITMHHILKNSPQSHNDISIHMELPYEEVTHPYTIHNESFKKVKNFAKESESAYAKRGKNGLIIYETIFESPVPYIDKMDIL